MTAPDSISLGVAWDPSNAEGVTGEPVTHDIEKGSLLLLAPTDVGKGSTLEIPNLLLGLRNTSVVVVDATGQNHAVTAKARQDAGIKTVCLNPMGLHLDMYPDDMISLGCNPMLAGLDPDKPSFFEKAVRIADSFDWSDGGDPFWPNAGRDVVAPLIGWVRVRDGDKANLSTVLHLLMEGEETDRDGLPTKGLRYTAAVMVAQCSGDKNTEWIADFAGQFLGGPAASSKTIDSIRQTAQTAARSLLSPNIREDLSKNGIDWAELTRRPVTVSLIVPAEDLELHSVWLRLMISCALNAIYSEAGQGSVFVLFLLSEFFALGKLPAVEAGFGQARKYKVRFWPVLQDYSQLVIRYGRDGASTFVANAYHMIAFAPGDHATARFLSEHCEEHRVKHVSMSENAQGDVSKNISEQREPLWSTTDIRRIPRHHALVWVYGNPAPQPVYLQPYYEKPECLRLARPDPYRRGMSSTNKSTSKAKGGAMRWVLKKVAAGVVIWLVLVVISVVWIAVSNAVQGR